MTSNFIECAGIPTPNCCDIQPEGRSNLLMALSKPQMPNKNLFFLTAQNFRGTIPKANRHQILRLSRL